MKVLIINGCMPFKAPYLQYYLKIIEEKNVQYELVSWDRDGTSDADYPSNYHIFQYYLPNTSAIYEKIWGYWRFRRFVQNIERLYQFDAIIIFTIPTALYFYKWFVGKYKGKYIFDIRDYSAYYKFPISRKMIDRIIGNSFETCISSPGFLNWLPHTTQSYMMSHNIDIDLIRRYSLRKMSYLSCDNDRVISILTIGQIRDVEANSAIVQAIMSDPMIRMTFVGYGPSMDILRERFEDNCNANVTFKGSYDKDEESEIVMQYDMINAYMPNNILSKTLMSNRFYLSVFHGKPIIVAEGSTQADYVDRFYLGVIIGPNDNVVQKIHSYWTQFNAEKYNDGRRQFLEIVESDYVAFEEKIKKFITK